MISQSRLSMTFDASEVVIIARKLRSLGFDHVKAVTGIDFIEANKIDVVYHISSFTDPEIAKVILVLRTTLNRSEPKISSVSEVWPSAEYSEKETSELMGITFKGLIMDRRFMLPEDFQGTPLRKDFKIKTEGIDA